MKVRVIHLLFFFLFSSYYFLSFLLSEIILWRKDVNRIKVDVVYKYIDLRDKELKREGFVQLEKDYDNEELRYSIRSVFENIPWVNKIFIIMPNNKVRFLKDTCVRKKKIIYIKDKDILGFDSSSSITFEHAALKNLKRFGVSDTFIYMNDDCFISKPLKKKDFFYYSENEKRFVPYVMKYFNNTVTDNYQFYKEFFNNHSYLLNKECKQTSIEYRFQNCLSILLLYKYFNRTDIRVLVSANYTWHNSLPLSIRDINELYRVVKNYYEYADNLLNATKRNNRQITYEPLYTFYFLNKYNRTFGNLTKKYYNMHRAYRLKKNKSDLFVLNKANDEGTDLENALCKYKMNNLFNHRYKEEVPEIENGIYYIHSYYNESLVFDAMNNIFFTKYIHLKPFMRKKSQMFSVIYRRNYYYLSSVYYKKRIIHSFSLRYFKQTISLGKDKKKYDSKWLLIPFKDNNFFFVSMKDKKFLQFDNQKNNKHNLLSFNNITTNSNMLFYFEAI